VETDTKVNLTVISPNSFQLEKLSFKQTFVFLQKKSSEVFHANYVHIYTSVYDII
jgi:hypothetical protein